MTSSNTAHGATDVLSIGLSIGYIFYLTVFFIFNKTLPLVTINMFILFTTVAIKYSLQRMYYHEFIVIIILD